MKPIPTAAQADAPVQFFCQHCGTRLAVNAGAAAGGGPCPSCGNWITGPKATAPQPETQDPPQQPPRQQAPSRIRGDISVDMHSLERRESKRSIIVLLMFILAAAACALVYVLMTSGVLK